MKGALLSFNDRWGSSEQLALRVNSDAPVLSIQSFSKEVDDYGDGDVEEYWTPYCGVTKFFDGVALAPNEAALDENNMAGIGDALVEAGVARSTGRGVASGFCVYPIYEFDMDVLSEYDSEGVSRYMEDNEAGFDASAEEIESDIETSIGKRIEQLHERGVADGSGCIFDGDPCNGYLREDDTFAFVSDGPGGIQGWRVSDFSDDNVTGGTRFVANSGLTIESNEPMSDVDFKLYSEHFGTLSDTFHKVYVDVGLPLHVEEISDDTFFLGRGPYGHTDLDARTVKDMRQATGDNHSDATLGESCVDDVSLEL